MVPYDQSIISFPCLNKWEYPWYAAWDLAFHSIALSIVDLDFTKLDKFLFHPSSRGVYEWNFSDVNPPVHAWATLFLLQMMEKV